MKLLLIFIFIINYSFCEIIIPTDNSLEENGQPRRIATIISGKALNVQTQISFLPILVYTEFLGITQNHTEYTVSWRPLSLSEIVQCDLIQRIKDTKYFASVKINQMNGREIEEKMNYETLEFGYAFIDDSFELKRDEKIIKRPAKLSMIMIGLTNLGVQDGQYATFFNKFSPKVSFYSTRGNSETEISYIFRPEEKILPIYEYSKNFKNPMLNIFNLKSSMNRLGESKFNIKLNALIMFESNKADAVLVSLTPSYDLITINTLSLKDINEFIKPPEAKFRVNMPIKYFYENDQNKFSIGLGISGDF